MGPNSVIRFDSEEVAMFCEQIAMLEKSGIPLYSGVELLYEELEEGRAKSVLKAIDSDLKDNIPFAQALENTGAFPDHMVHMTRVGETTGKLEEVMNSLTQYYDRDSRVRAGIRSAISYPLILFGVMTVILAILAIKILPMFETMFSELNSEVSEATTSAVSFGLGLGKVLAVIIGVLFVAAIALVLWYRTSKGKRVLDGTMNRIASTRKLMRLMSVGKFLSSMALMVSAGEDNRESLISEVESCENAELKEQLQKVLEYYDSEHMPLEEAISKAGVLKGMEGRMLMIAGRTGTSEAMYQKLSETYNEKISDLLGRLTTVIETVLVVCLSVLTGAVLLSVMIPLVSMISSIG